MSQSLKKQKEWMMNLVDNLINCKNMIDNFASNVFHFTPPQPTKVQKSIRLRVNGVIWEIIIEVYGKPILLLYTNFA